MSAVLLSIALTWSTGCLTIGQLYETAARLRDTGIELEVALKRSTAKRVQLALRHVYSEPGMNPEAWRWFAIGICVEQEGRAKERDTRGAGLPFS